MTMPDAFLVIGALALTLSIVIALFFAETASAVLIALVLFYLVPAEERAELTALIEATRKPARTRRMLLALRRGLQQRLRACFRRRSSQSEQ
jgi:hypothetical protein